MDAALKEIVVPFLREKGFTGSLPHFRKIKEDRINLLTVQHSSYSEQFVVEIASCPAEGITTSWGKEIKSNKCTAHDVGYRRRLGSKHDGADFWFDYSRNSLFTNIYKKRAMQIIGLWDDAERWWQENSKLV